MSTARQRRVSQRRVSFYINEEQQQLIQKQARLHGGLNRLIERELLPRLVELEHEQQRGWKKVVQQSSDDVTTK